MRGTRGGLARWLALMGLLPLAAAHGETSPRWEVGIGSVGLSMPNYRGSDEHTAYLLPFPYLIYNGSRLRVDRDGVRSNLFHSERVTLEFSAAAGIPARSGAGARENMPDLDPTFEIGPAVRVDLDDDTDNTEWALVFPVRGVLATDFSGSRSLGWVFSPFLQYEVENFYPGWRFNLSGGPLYAGELYHDYYYEVDPKFATADRPAYDARGGYSGARVTVTLSRRYRSYWIGAFARYDSLSDAAFEDSPLVRTNRSFMMGLGVAWVFARPGTAAPESSDPR